MGGTLISLLICILAVNVRLLPRTFLTKNITVEAAVALGAWVQVFLLQMYLVSFAFHYLGTKLT